MRLIAPIPKAIITDKNGNKRWYDFHDSLIYEDTRYVPAGLLIDKIHKAIMFIGQTPYT